MKVAIEEEKGKCLNVYSYFLSHIGYHLSVLKHMCVRKSKYMVQVVQVDVQLGQSFYFYWFTNPPTLFFPISEKKKKIYIFPKLSTSSGIFLTEQVLCFRIHLNHQSAYNNEDFTMISSF